jgi:hypothetical protein
MTNTRSVMRKTGSAKYYYTYISVFLRVTRRTKVRN